MRTTTIRVLTALAILVLAAAFMAACMTDSESDDAVETATASMSGADGSDMGTVTFIQGPRGVLVSADVSGLSEGWHGFHVHSVGGCEPDFSAAGGHFAPNAKGHGFTREDGGHPGDMPNIYAGANGVARADYFHHSISLTTGDGYLFDSDGSAIIIHAKPDSYGEDPAAGDRVACGVITR